MRTNTSPFRGGYYSHGKQFIENLPVPVPDEARRSEIEARTAVLVTALDDLAAVRTPRARTRKEREVHELHGDVEALVSAVFELSAADMTTIDAVPIPS